MPVNAKPRTEILPIVGLTLIALISRYYALSAGGLTHDEIYTVEFAAERVNSIVNPAYYALTLLSFELFGVSEWSARLPAMLLGVISVPVFFITWRNVIGRNAALIGALLIIFSAWHLWYSQFARFYTGVFLFGSLSYYLFYRALVRDDLLRLTGALIAAAVGFFFHATVVMVLAACAVYALLVFFVRSSTQAGLSRRVAKVYLGVCIVGAIGAGTILWNIWQTRQSSGATWGDPPWEMVLQIVHSVQLPLAVAAFLGLVVLLRRSGWLGVYFLVGIALPTIFVLTAAVFLNSRSAYLFYALPLIIGLAGVLCEEVRVALAPKNWVASHALTGILLATLLPELLSHYTGRLSLDVRDVVSYIESVREPGDIVISFPDEFDHYARGRIPFVSAPTHPRLASRERPAEMSAAVAGYDHAWIILNRSRTPIARDLQDWLGEHASLAWRRSERRLDYVVKEYEVYRVDGEAAAGAKP